jgi:hypothetical protein
MCKAYFGLKDMSRSVPFLSLPEISMGYIKVLGKRGNLVLF